MWIYSVLKHESHSVTAQFIESLFAFGFLPMITKPTRITAHSATLTENIFTNNTTVSSTNGLIMSDISQITYWSFQLFLMITCVKIATALLLGSYEWMCKGSNLINTKSLMVNVALTLILTGVHLTRLDGWWSLMFGCIIFFTNSQQVVKKWTKNQCRKLKIFPFFFDPWDTEFPQPAAVKVCKFMLLFKD